MDISYLLDSLNDAQRDAVCAPAGHQLILAGAGSGKTRVLVHRIAWLIHVERVSPRQILAVTFTNKAAREMRERLHALLGNQVLPGDFRQLWVGTFHGIAHRLLKMHWQDAGLPQNFHILDSDDQLRLIKRVYQELKLDEDRWPCKQSQWFINGQKDEGIRPLSIPDTHEPFLQTMKQIYLAYEAACTRAGVVDFAELLLRSHELWLQNEHLRTHYQQRFPYILVDEFQDTNAVQYAWLRVLAGQYSRITAVGDDDQSIYGWRGARIENIQSFSDDFRDVNVTRLEQNYRSSNTILQAANAVIANNRSRLGKRLWTAGGDGEPIDLYTAFNEQDEARFVVERIEKHIATGHPRASAAILYRSNAQSRVFEESLIRQGIAYRIYGGLRFFDRLEIKNALGYLRLILNPQDDTAFERVVNIPTRGIGAKSMGDLRAYATEQGKHDEAWRRMLTAYFGESFPIFDRDSLLVLAGEIGVDPTGAEEALTSRRFKPQVFEDQAEAQALGATDIGVAWIPHDAPFTVELARQTAEDFNLWGSTAIDYGLRFYYHNHGYEFRPDSDGTIPFDVLMEETDPATVFYEMDVFWTVHPGVDPVELLRRYPDRWKLMHIKDMAEGTPTGDFSGGAPAEAQVVVGTGQIDMAAVLDAAEEIGVEKYYVEDETTDPVGNIPLTLQYLQTITY